jgi:hypothetical protein
MYDMQRRHGASPTEGYTEEDGQIESREILTEKQPTAMRN